MQDFAVLYTKGHGPLPWISCTYLKESLQQQDANSALLPLLYLCFWYFGVMCSCATRLLYSLRNKLVKQLNRDLLWEGGWTGWLPEFPPSPTFLWFYYLIQMKTEFWRICLSWLHSCLLSWLFFSLLPVLLSFFLICKCFILLLLLIFHIPLNNYGFTGPSSSS